MSKKVISALGATLVIISLIFISVQLWNEKDALKSWTPTINSLAALIVGSILYCLSNYLLALNWHRLFVIFNVKNISKQQVNNIYAKSQIAKYIPGNVAHIAGRHFLLRQLGVSHLTLIASASYEMMGLGLSAISIISIGVLFFSINMAYNIDAILSVTLLLCGLITYFFGLNLVRFFFQQTSIPRVNPDLHLYVELITVLCIYLCFFSFAGGVLFILTASLNVDLSSLLALRVLTCFSLAWLLGFITPGSPSGIGIRETIIVLMLGDDVGTAYAIILAILFRVTTVLGDVLFLLIAGTNRDQKLVS